jgi:regulator of sigma E protease
MDFLSLLRFLFLLSILIFVHESGHFLLAKFFGVKVEEFGFGIPPRVWGKKIRGTIYSLNILPIGGFVRLKGEEGEFLGFGGADSFAVKSKLKRTAILVAGVLGNFLFAWFIFSILLGFGTTVLAGKAVIEGVGEESPAAAVGVSVGDFIVSFAGEKTRTSGELIKIVNENLGKLSVMVVESNGVRREITVTPRIDPPEGEGPLGIVTSSVVEKEVSAWEAPFWGIWYTSQYLVEMVKGLGQIVVDAFRGVAVQVGGPLAVYSLSKAYAVEGWDAFAQLMALLSLNLVVVNLLPIPALDGGRILFIAIEAIRRKKLSPEIERTLNSLGFAFLLILVALITAHDIKTFF